MGIRELKNQILYEMKKINEFSSEIQEIEPSEIGETETESEKDIHEVFEPARKIELTKDVKQEIIPPETIETKLKKIEPESLEADKKIKLAMDIKQVLKDIVHHLEPEYFPQKSSYPLKASSRLFDKLDVRVFSEKSTTRAYKNDKVPGGLKSKFGVIKEYSGEDKQRAGSLFQPKVGRPLGNVLVKDFFTIMNMPKSIKNENEIKENLNTENKDMDTIIDNKKEIEITKKGESKK